MNHFDDNWFNFILNTVLINSDPCFCDVVVGQLDRSSFAEYKRMRTCAESWTMQTDTAAATANASTSTLATGSPSPKNEPYAVKFVFKKNELKKIDRIYADWISDLPR